MNKNDKIVLFDGVSGSGKSTVISKIFYELKKRNINLAIIPDITHFTQILIPFNNLYEGGGIEEYSYFYLFLDRLIWHYKCIHTLLTTKEHDFIFIDESPLTEYAVAKVRGARDRYLNIMESLLDLYYENIDKIFYITLDEIENYKHYKKGIEYNRKRSMFEEADKILKNYLIQNQKEKLIICSGNLENKIKIVYENLLCRR